jgi:hypothetical protein
MVGSSQTVSMHPRAPATQTRHTPGHTRRAGAPHLLWCKVEATLAVTLGTVHQNKASPTLPHALYGLLQSNTQDPVPALEGDTVKGEGGTLRAPGSRVRQAEDPPPPPPPYHDPRHGAMDSPAAESCHHRLPWPVCRVQNGVCFYDEARVVHRDL